MVSSKMLVLYHTVFQMLQSILTIECDLGNLEHARK